MIILKMNGTVPSLPPRPSCWGAYLRTGTTLIFHLHTRHTHTHTHKSSNISLRTLYYFIMDQNL